MIFPGVRIAGQIVDVGKGFIGTVSRIGGPGFPSDFTWDPLPIGAGRAREALTGNSGKLVGM